MNLGTKFLSNQTSDNNFVEYLISKYLFISLKGQYRLARRGMEWEC